MVIVFLITATVSCIIAAMRIYGYDHFTPSAVRYYYNDYKQVYSKTGAADIIIIGNSKALQSLSSKIIYTITKQICYNLGMGGANLAYSKLTLNTYLHNATRVPRYCFLEISWFSFNTQRTGFPLKIASSLLFKDIEPIKYIIRYPELRQNSIGILYDDILQRFSNKTKHNVITYGDYSEKGNQGETIEPKKQGETIEPKIFDVEKMKTTFPGFKAGIDSDLLHDFVDIIKICKKNNIKLILYNAPELPEYTAKQMDRYKIKQEIYKLAAKHNLKYYDFTIDGEFWNKDYISQLGDSHHLKDPDRFTKDFMAVLSQEGMF